MITLTLEYFQTTTYAEVFLQHQQQKIKHFFENLL